MKSSEPACSQGSELARHFKACAPSLRIDTFARLIDTLLAIVSAHSVNLHDIAPKMPGHASLEAKQRRAQRAIHDPQLTAELFLLLMLSQLPPGKLLLSMDRTNWKRGDTSLNLLVLGAVVEGYTIPLVWTALDHGGNSDTAARCKLINQLLKVLPGRRWLGIVADREFIGAEWFRFLRRKRIRRAVRIRKDSHIDDMRASEWFGDLEVGELHCLAEKAFVYGEIMQVFATRSPAGDLVIIATDFDLWKTRELYRQRWSVECTFSSMKSRGFDLERTGIIQKDRLERLFGVVTLAWVSCLRVGVWQDGIKPIKVKAHGRRAVSLVRLGTQHLQEALRWGSHKLKLIMALLTSPFCPPERAGGQVVRY